MKIHSHYITIRSAYKDAKLSQQRLRLLQQITIPCLTQQSRNVILAVNVSSDDPCLAERKAAFESTGLQCNFIEREKAAFPVTLDNVVGCDRWQIPTGVPTLVMRLDDDDAIANNYCQRTHDFAELNPEMNGCYMWPNGYLKLRDKAGEWRLRQMRHESNMFCTILTESGESPQDENHGTIKQRRPLKFVTERRGWVWVRHSCTMSPEAVARCWKGRFDPFPKEANNWAIKLTGIPDNE